MKSLILIIAAIISSVTAAKITPKIVGGRDAVENEFPYVVSIRRAEMEIILGDPYHVCGGSIINANTVLTAGHCLYDPFGNHLTQPYSYFVVAGILRMFTDSQNAKYFAVVEIYSHPAFDPETLINDIAIFKVAPEFTFDLPNIQPISIDYNQDIEEGRTCSVHGWGTLIYGFNLYPDVLQTVDLKTSNFNDCNETYSGVIDSKMFCAYELEKDSCSGDSGSSFVCNNMLVGIVSFGYKCAVPEVPGVYTKIAAYRGFIENYDKVSSAASHSIKLELVFITFCFGILLSST